MLMNRHRLLVRLAGLGAVLWATFGFEANAGASGALSAEEVFAAHVRAIGGKEAVLKKRGVRLRGRFDVRAQDLSAEVEIIRAEPNLQVFKLRVPGQGTIAGGYNGQIGWISNPVTGADPVTGAQLLKGPMLEQARDDADFYSQFQIYRPERIQRAEGRGLTEFAGQECHEVRLTRRNGREETLFFSTRNGLLAGHRKMQQTSQGPVEVTSRLSDYQRFDDVLQPTTIAQEAGDMRMRFTFSQYAFEEIPESEFDLPVQIVELLRAE
jgi:hypothetical protein